MFGEVSVICCGTNGIELSQEKWSLVSVWCCWNTGKWAVSTKAIFVGGKGGAVCLFLPCSNAFGVHSSCVWFLWSSGQICVQCGYEEGSILSLGWAGVSTNWWTFPRGCDSLVGTGVPWDFPLWCFVAGRLSCKKNQEFGPRAALLSWSSHYPLVTAWSKPWAATREKQRALFWVPVKKRALLEGDISSFPFVFSLIIPFSLGWHLTALPAWWGNAGSLNLGLFLVFPLSYELRVTSSLSSYL